MKVPPPNTYRPRPRGFTLTEVLISVGVIAILAGLMLPSINAAKKSAMAAKGISNISQLAKAQILYAQENNGSFTAHWVTDTTAVWQQRLYPYLGLDIPLWDIRTMNSLRMDPKSIFNVPDSKPKEKRLSGETSIAMNGWMADSAMPWKYKMLNVPEPSKTILLGEVFPEKNGEGMNQAPSKFDRGGRNQMIMAFCDGHVEALDLSQLSSDASKRNGRQNPWNWWSQ